MLINLNIKDFAIVEQLNLEFDKGMISLTGETGAGKSILLGAIGLVLGEKSMPNTVRKGAEKTVVSATFDISKLPKVKEYLEYYDCVGEDSNECIIRRVIRKDGRSSVFINDNSSSLSRIKDLGESLVEIHGQHQHQSINKDKKQLDLLDGYLGLKELRNKVSFLYKDFQKKEKEYEDIKVNFDENFNSYQLLRYQLKELEELSLFEGEYEGLEDEMKMLESSSDVISNCEHSLSILKDSDDDNGSIISRANMVLKNINNLDDELLDDVKNMVKTAIINLEESAVDLSKYMDRFEVNPEKEAFVSSRLKSINRIANKMNVFPENIYNLREEVIQKMKGLNYSEDAVEELKKSMNVAYDLYMQNSAELSLKRKEGAVLMSNAVNSEARKLNLSDDILKIVFDDEKEIKTSSGIDKISFYIRPNLGQEYQPMKKIASGGEMSRISLAIQVVSLKNDNVPTMIFDEVDTGLSGETGNVVGSMLRAVGSIGQVMCVTHLPQVAAQGHSHYVVSKRNVKRENVELTLSSIKQLDDNERVQEIARMIGGDISSKESFGSAKLMLSMNKK